MGSDRGASTMIEGALAGRPLRRYCSPCSARPSSIRAASRSSRRRRSSAWTRSRRNAFAPQGRQLPRPPSRPSPTERPTWSCRPATRERCSRSLVLLRRVPGVRRPAIAVPLPARAGRLGPDRRGRERRLPGRAPAPVRDDGRRLRPADPRHRSGRPCRPLSIGEEPEKGNQLTLEAHGLLARPPISTSAATPRDATCSEGGADVLVTDGFTGNVALKAVEGHDPRRLLDALREEITATHDRQARRPADPPGARAAAASASTRTRTAARTCSACAGSW